MSDNGIITKCITKRITELSPLSSGAELQIQKIAAQISAQISAKARYRIIGNPLTLIISAMALEACGSSAGAGAAAVVEEIIYGGPDDTEGQALDTEGQPLGGDNSYSWSSGKRITIYEQFNQGEDTVRLNGVNIADVSFSRNPIVSDPVADSDQFTTKEVTLSIAGQSIVILPYEQYDSDEDGTIGGADEYYRGVEKVHFGELELNLIYQSQFAIAGVAVAGGSTVTTAGSRDADLIIGFDIAGERDSSGNYMRDLIQAGAGDDYVYGLDGNDSLFGQADNDVLNGGAGNDALFGDFGNDILNGGADNDALYGGADDDALNGGTGDDNLNGNAGNDRFFYSKGDGNDEITEVENEGDDTLFLTGFSVTDIQSVDIVDDTGMVDANGINLKLIFTPTTVSNADGSTSMLGNSVLLRDSINATAVASDNDTGVDKIHFDSNSNGIEDDTETFWLDETFVFWELFYS